MASKNWNWLGTKKKFLLLMGMVLITLSLIAYANPFKVTDPADPQFNPDKFRFEDYRGIPPMMDALKKLFPVGTSKEFVEKVLVDTGGASIEISKVNVEKIIYNKSPDYAFPIPLVPKRMWVVGVFYNEIDAVYAVTLNGRLIVGELIKEKN